MIRLINILHEILVNKPSLSLDNIKSLPFLDLKIGKYDISKGRRGRAVPFNSKYVDPRTRRRVMSVFDKLGIKPEKTYVAWIVDDKTGYLFSLRSTFIVSSYKDEPIIIAQTQTEHPSAGQMYLYSKYFKSGKSLRLPDPREKNKDDSHIYADTNATKEEILKALQYDNL